MAVAVAAGLLAIVDAQNAISGVLGVNLDGSAALASAIDKLLDLVEGLLGRARRTLLVKGTEAVAGAASARNELCKGGGSADSEQDETLLDHKPSVAKCLSPLPSWISLAI